MPPVMFANRYRVLRMLGEGAMGVVWAVEDTTNGAQVALKVISQAYGATRKSILQFKQEFRLMTQLRHPNCCAVYDYGLLPEGEPYFTMEEVPGHGLDELLPLPAERFVPVLSQLLLALGYVHQLGFVHRDLKAENVRLRPDGTVTLMDYGLMEYARRTGATINGTVAYLAPEVITRGSIDPRTDLYSVGVLAFELLTGRQPFLGDQPNLVLKAHVSEPPPRPSDLAPGVDPLHERIVLKLLAKDPLDRYQSAYQVLEDLGAEVPAGIGGNLLTSPLMGREPELRVLAGHMRAIASAEPGAGLLLWGPSGIGKSRLLEEFRYAVQLENLASSVGACYEHGNAPYEPFVAALKGLLPALGARVPEALARHAPVLVRLLPELAVEPAPELDSPTKEKLRLQSAIAELLTALATEQALVLVLEDWQWADPLSDELLDYLLRNTRQQPILYLVTAREPLGQRLEACQRLAVGTLDREGVRRMVQSMLGSEDVHGPFIDRVTELSKGMPFFVEKLLEHLVQNLTIQNEHGRWTTDVELPLNRLPNNLKGLLMWRITCLSEPAQVLARIGAVAGPEFDLELLKAVAGFGEEEFFGAIESLAMHQIFLPREEGRYQFAQDQIQELVYANIESAEKRRLHGAIAEVLEGQLPAVPLVDMPLDLVTAMAQHCLEAGLVDKTIIFALEAGMRSAALFANAEAERFLTAGLALVRQEGVEERVLLDYLRCLGDVWRVTGRSEVAREAYLEAIAIAEAFRARFMLGRMLTHLARCEQVLGCFPEALAAGERALTVCRDNQDPAGAARALVQMARIQYFMGNMPAAVGLAERALASAREGDDRPLVGEALAMIGYFHVASHGDRVEEGVADLDRSVAILTEEGDQIALNTSYNFLGTAQNMLGHFKDAQASFSQNRAICYQIGAQDELIFALLNLAITAYELGDFAETGRMAAEARAIAERLNSRFPLGMAMVLGAIADLYQGRLSRVQADFEAALVLARELKHRYMESQVLLYQVEALLTLGCLEEARSAGEVLSRLIAESGDREPESKLKALQGEILGRLGQYEAAEAAVDASLRAANASSAQGVQVRAQAAKAWLAMRRGEHALARRLAEGTLIIASRLGAQLQEARLWLILGEVALATERGHPLAPFEQAARIAGAIGWDALLASARFGQAAADPDDPAAARWIREAQALLTGLAASLDPDTRRAFERLDDRARILAGDLGSLGAPAPPKPAEPGVAPRLGLNPDLWNRL